MPPVGLVVETQSDHTDSLDLVLSQPWSTNPAPKVRISMFLILLLACPWGSTESSPLLKESLLRIDGCFCKELSKNPSIVHMSLYSTLSASYTIANILSVPGMPVSDSMYRQSPRVKPASLSTVISAKRGTAGSMSSRHMRGAMTISIRRLVSFSHPLDCKRTIMPMDIITSWLRTVRHQGIPKH